MRKDFRFELSDFTARLNGRSKNFAWGSVFSVLLAFICLGSGMPNLAFLPIGLALVFACFFVYYFVKVRNLAVEERDAAYLNWVKTRAPEDAIAERKKILLDLALYYGNELAEDVHGEGTDFDKAVVEALVGVRAKFCPTIQSVPVFSGTIPDNVADHAANILSEEHLNA